jgi:hypothetical protein
MYHGLYRGASEIRASAFVTLAVGDAYARTSLSFELISTKLHLVGYPTSREPTNTRHELPGEA